MSGTAVQLTSNYSGSSYNGATLYFYVTDTAGNESAEANDAYSGGNYARGLRVGSSSSSLSTTVAKSSYLRPSTSVPTVPISFVDTDHGIHRSCAGSPDASRRKRASGRCRLRLSGQRKDESDGHFGPEPASALGNVGGKGSGRQVPGLDSASGRCSLHGIAGLRDEGCGVSGGARQWVGGSGPGSRRGAFSCSGCRDADRGLGPGRSGRAFRRKRAETAFAADRACPGPRSLHRPIRRREAGKSRTL